MFIGYLGSVVGSVAAELDEIPTLLFCLPLDVLCDERPAPEKKSTVLYEGLYEDFLLFRGPHVFVPLSQCLLNDVAYNRRGYSLIQRHCIRRCCDWHTRIRLRSYIQSWLGVSTMEFHMFHNPAAIVRMQSILPAGGIMSSIIRSTYYINTME